VDRNRFEGYFPQFTWRNPGWPQTKDQAQDHPVGNVSWNDAVKFCEWLSKKTGKRSGSPPRPSGSTPVALARRPDSSPATTRPASRAMPTFRMKPCAKSSASTPIRQRFSPSTMAIRSPLPLAASSRTRGAFATCWATSSSGVRTKSPEIPQGESSEAAHTTRTSRRAGARRAGSASRGAGTVIPVFA
jgi:hypothetical protein